MSDEDYRQPEQAPPPSVTLGSGPNPVTWASVMASCEKALDGANAEIARLWRENEKLKKQVEGAMADGKKYAEELQQVAEMLEVPFAPFRSIKERLQDVLMANKAQPSPDVAERLLSEGNALCEAAERHLGWHMDMPSGLTYAIRAWRAAHPKEKKP